MHAFTEPSRVVAADRQDKSVAGHVGHDPGGDPDGIGLRRPRALTTLLAVSLVAALLLSTGVAALAAERTVVLEHWTNFR